MSHITVETLAYGVEEVIKAFTDNDQDAPGLLYQLAYELKEPHADIAKIKKRLEDFLSDFDMVQTCPGCQTELPESLVCLYCGNDFETNAAVVKKKVGKKPVVKKKQKAANGSPVVYKQARKGSQKAIVEACIRKGMLVNDIVDEVKKDHPDSEEKAIITNVSTYVSDWRSIKNGYGWDISDEHSFIKLENTNGNG